MKYYLAIDLGATSGRHIIGYKEDGKIVLKEIRRKIRVYFLRLSF